jgi:hypothetical protein
MPGFYGWRDLFYFQTSGLRFQQSGVCVRVAFVWVLNKPRIVESQQLKRPVKQSQDNITNHSDMKRKLILSSTVISALLASGAMAQVVNFHDAANGQLAFPGVGYEELFAGQGAYSDPGNDIWNGFGQYQGYQSTYFYSGGPGGGGPWPQESGNPGNPYAAYNGASGWVTSTGPNLFSFASGSLTNSGNATSGGQWTPITLSVKPYGVDNGLGNGSAFALPNGAPGFLLGEAAVNDSEVFTLQNVPAGTYGLYLYGANSNNNRGTLFSVNSGSAHNGIAATLNSGVGTPANRFAEGDNFVIFQDVTPDVKGNITITATPNPKDGDGNSNLGGEVDVNGFQLIFNPPPTAVGSTAAQNVWAGGTANFSFSPAFASSPSFRWQSIIGGATNNLSDGANIAGSATANLTLTSVSTAEAGLYQCVFWTATATNTSPAAPLTILSSTATSVLQQGDSATTVGEILAAGDSLFDFGTNTAAPYNSIPPPFDMTVTKIEDGTLDQYVNFGANGSVAPFLGPVGFVVTPKVGATVMTGMRFFTASSHPEDDPADYLLEGSNDGDTNFTTISSGLLGLPAQRNAAGGAINITNQVLKEIDFANSTAYSTYRLTFTNVNNDTLASNGLQIAEIQFLGTLPAAKPGIAQQPPTNEVLLAGATLSASVVASGVGPFSYKWYYDSSQAITNATNATLTVANVQTANNGTYNCVVSNSYGSTNSVAVKLTVLAPTPYEAAVIANQALAFYPLNETNGVTAYDYLGAAEGTYQTNAALGQPGVPNPPFLGFQTSNLSAGISAYAPNSWVLAPFGTLAGPDNLTLPNLTFTCWIYPQGTQNAYLGLIFDRGGAVGGLDMGANSGMLGYTWNNNAGNTSGFVSNLTPPQNQWSLAALTITPTQAVLYLCNANGRFAATNAIPHSEGLLDGVWHIGNDAYADPGRTFNGMIGDVAIFTNALSLTQINALYDVAAQATTNVAPIVAVASGPFTVDQGGNGAISASVIGPPPLSYQWYYLASGSSSLIAGATNSTLALTDIQADESSYQYYVVVSNAYGVVTSSYATLSILSGAPALVTDVSPLLTEVPAGVPVTFWVAATGTEPFTYQWSNESGAIAGATDSSYTFDAVAGSNNYSVRIGNSVGSISSSTAVVVGLTNHPPVVTFDVNGTNWSLNQGSTITPTLISNVLTLTDGQNSESTSAFFNTPQYIGGFIASFIYTAGGSRGSDGTTFCIQDDPNSTNATGGGGGDLGYYGITNSAAFELNLYSGANGGTGIQFGTDGSTADSPNPTAHYSSPGLIGVGSGDPIHVQLYYGQNVLTVSLEDPITGDTFVTNYAADLPSIVGSSSAFVGFTGATGGVNSIQAVSDFQFSYTTAPILSVARGTAGSVVVSWPVSVSTLFELQQSTAINGPWLNVTETSAVVNSQNEVTLTPGANTEFFRLSLQ